MIVAVGASASPVEPWPEKAGVGSFVNAPAEEAHIPQLADAAVFHFTHDLMQTPAALDNVFRSLKPGARVVATGLKWARWWSPGVNLFVRIAAMRSTTTMAGLDGERRMFAFQRLPDTDAYLVIGIDAKEALGRVEREMDLAYVWLGVVCAVVLFGVWFGGERLIVQPLRSLARAAERIGRGNLDARLSKREWAAEFEYDNAGL